MVARKRQSLSQAEGVGEPVAKRRSSRRLNPAPEVEDTGSKAQKATEAKAKTTKTQSSAKNGQPAKDSGSQAPAKSDDNKGRKTASKKAKSKASTSQTDATVPEPAADSKSSQAVPDRNPEAPRHDGEWYWLMKAEPESRFENGIDVRFSIDDLRAKKEPEGWDGIRAYAGKSWDRQNAGAGRLTGTSEESHEEHELGGQGVLLPLELQGAWYCGHHGDCEGVL